MNVPLRINELINYNLDSNIRDICIMMVTLSIGLMIALYLLNKWR